MQGTKTTGEAVVDALVAHGTDTVFGLPGAHVYDFNDALQRESDRIRFITTRHEQAAGYMAFGYAHSTGRPAVYSVVPGPGVLNSGAALCTAYAANAPVLCVTGNIMSHLIGRGRGQLHELKDQLSLLRGLTRHAERINHASEAPAAVGRAFEAMVSGRGGPAAVEAPWDVFGKRGLVADTAPAAPAEPPGADPEEIEAAARMIREAKRPLVFVGGGAREAAQEVASLARRLGAPVTAHRNGRGVVPDDDARALSLIGAYEYWKECDLLVGIGSRLEVPTMRWRWKPPALKTLRIDIDPTEMVRLRPDAGVVADSAAALKSLLQCDLGPDNRVPQEELEAISARSRKAFTKLKPLAGYLDAIRDVLPRDGFFVDEVAQIGFTARLGFPVYHPRSYVSSAYQESLGFGFNTALGVQVANPGKAVLSVNGDGGFMFGVQELATMAKYSIPVVAVVFNNSAYGNVRRDQMERYSGRLLGADLENPDFVKLGESFGVESKRVSSPKALGAALEEGFGSNSPMLVEVPVETGSEASPWIHHTPPPHTDG